MRKTLLILLAAIVLAPDPTGFPAGPVAQACECEPVACHCSGHNHGAAHGPMCAIANGGKCGMRSADLALGAITGRFQFLVTELTGLPRQSSARFEFAPVTASDLPGHEKPPKQPPRLVP